MLEGWQRFLILLASSLILSFILAFVIWRLCGNELSFEGVYLDLEFLNVMFGTFEILGLSIAIFELTELRTRKQT
jgi:hypothetical protein